MRSSAHLPSPLRLACAVAALAATSCTAQIHSPQINIHRKPAPEDLSWLWQYTQPGPGNRENELIGDPRFKALLKQNLTAPQSFWETNKPLSDVALEFLAVPGDVTGDENRYVSVTGCVPHFCPSRGLLWVDLGLAHPLIVFNAIDWIKENRATVDKGAAYALWIFPNRVLNPEHPPDALIRSIARWTSQPSPGSTELQNITRVFLVDPDGTPHPVTPSAIGAHNNLPAETTTGMETKVQ